MIALLQYDAIVYLKMEKHQTSAIDYKLLTVTTLRAKSAYFLLGVLVIAVIVSVAGFFMRNFLYISPVTQPKLKQVVKSTLKPKMIIPKANTYTMQEGDDLSAVSQKMYGSVDYVSELMKANTITDSNNISVGALLSIPSVIAKSKQQGDIGTGAMTSQVQFKGSTYTVQAGESLSDIAVKIYGDSNAWQKIADLNNISDPNVVTEGMILKIP